MTVAVTHSPESGAGPTLRARPFSAAADRSSRIDNLLSRDEQAELAKLATVLDYRRAGIAIFSEGEDAHFLYAIDRGVIRVSRHNDDGSRQVLAFMWQGDLVGLAERGRYVNSADTAGPARLYRFPLQKLRQLLLREPRLRLHMLTKAVHDLRSAQRQIVVLGQLSVPRRLATFLHDFAQHSEVSDARNRCLTLSVSRFDIADYLGTSAENVTRAFSILERDGFVRRRTSRVIEILNMRELGSFHSRWGRESR
jgi:CRP/FNR family transcriptional regulator, anaerobic regulatory protein